MAFQIGRELELVRESEGISDRIAPLFSRLPIPPTGDVNHASKLNRNSQNAGPVLSVSVTGIGVRSLNPS